MGRAFAGPPGPCGAARLHGAQRETPCSKVDATWTARSPKAHRNMRILHSGSKAQEKEDSRDHGFSLSRFLMCCISGSLGVLICTCVFMMVWPQSLDFRVQSPSVSMHKRVCKYTDLHVYTYVFRICLHVYTYIHTTREREKTISHLYLYTYTYICIHRRVVPPSKHWCNSCWLRFHSAS